MAELWGLLLAAGSSTRLGRPKQLVDVGGQTALRWSARQLAAVTDHRTLVVLGYAHERMRRQLADLQCTIILNPDWKTGMASSLKIGLDALPARADGVLVSTCDQLKVAATDLERLCEAWSEARDRPVAARYSETLGVPAIFPRSWFDRFEQLSGDHGAKPLLLDDESVIGVDLPEAAFDLDTEDDLKSFTERPIESR